VIKFGNGTRGPSASSCLLGSILGTVAIIPGLVNSILNVPKLNGMATLWFFGADEKCPISSEDGSPLFSSLLPSTLLTS
jgi:hypothetical protein